MATTLSVPHTILLDLPQDVLALIIANVDLLDIFSLRQSCKTLNFVTRERHIWLHVLRERCETHRLFRPSYSFETLSPLQLEETALRPFKLCHSLANGADNVFRLRDYISAEEVYRQSEVHASQLPRRWTDFLDGYLVPGGRFFLVIVGSPKEYLSIWDLGPSCQPSEGWKQLASVYLGEDINPEFAAILPTPCGEGLRILVQRTPENDRELCYAIHEIFPTQKEPQFRPLYPKIDEPEDWKQTIIKVFHGHSVNEIVLHWGNMVAIWNVQLDTCMTVDVGAKFEAICDAGDCILLLNDSGEVQAWQATSTQPGGIKDNLKLRQKFYLPLPSHPRESTIARLDFLNNSANGKKWIAVVSRVNIDEYEDEDEEIIYYHDIFELQRARDPEYPSSEGMSYSDYTAIHLPLREPMLDYTSGKHLEMFIPEAAFKFGDYYLRYDCLLDHYDEVKWLTLNEIASSAEPQQPGSRSVIQKMVFAVPSMGVRGDGNFCPYSGRVVKLQGDRATIMEYQ